MKFRFVFPKDYKDTMKQVFENEKRIFENANMGFRWKWLARRMEKIGIRQIGKTQVDYEFVSDTEALVTIITGYDAMIKEEFVLKRLKEYEKISAGEVKVDLIKDG